MMKRIDAESESQFNDFDEDDFESDDNLPSNDRTREQLGIL